MEMLVTEEFERQFRELPQKIRQKLYKQEVLFRDNPFHPSLHTEKLQPKKKEYWSFRVDRSYRVLFRFKDAGTVILITVGTHDWVYRFK